MQRSDNPRPCGMKADSLDSGSFGLKFFDQAHEMGINLFINTYDTDNNCDLKQLISYQNNNKIIKYQLRTHRIFISPKTSNQMIPLKIMFIIASLLLVGGSSEEISDNSNMTIVQIPSVIEYDVKNKSVQKFMHIRIEVDQQANQYQTLYFASNFQVEIFCSGNKITNETDFWDISLKKYGLNVTIKIILTQHIKQFTQPLIIYVGDRSQNLLRPMRRSKTYLMRQNQKYINSQPKGRLYLIKPYIHSLKAYIKILEGYISILPYVCPKRKIAECQVGLIKKIKQQHNQLASNYFIMYSKISLNQHQIFDLDYCNNCYLILYVSCKIGQCSLRMSFDLGSAAQLQLSTPLQQNNQIIQLRQNRLSQLEAHKIYSFNRNSNSQIVYKNSPRIQLLYHSCSTYQMTYRISLFTQFLLIRNNKLSSLETSLMEQNCWIKQEYSSKKSWVYYTNYLPQIMQINRQYPIKLTRQNPSIYHYKYSHQRTSINGEKLYLNVKKCIDGPIKLTYYVLPDFQAIKNKKLELFEKDKQTEEWVASKSIRIVSSEISIKIAKNEGEYMTDYLMIELVPDSYSYAIVSVSNEPIYSLQPKTNNKMEVTQEDYIQTENENEISIHLQINIQTMEKQKKINNIKLVEMNNTDTFYKEEQCKQMTVMQRYESSMQDTTRVIAQNSHTLAYEVEGQLIKFNISMDTYSKYIGISMEVNQLQYFHVLEVKSKINLVYKFKWILLSSVLMIVLIIYAAYQLSISLKRNQ